MSRFVSHCRSRWLCVSILFLASATSAVHAQQPQLQLARVAGDGVETISRDGVAPHLPLSQSGRTFDMNPRARGIPRLFGPVETLMNSAKRLAITAYDQEKHDESSRLLSLALLLDPADVDLLRRLGFALKSIGRYEEAHDALAAAVRRDPGDFNAWWWLGDTQRLLGDYDAAIECLRKSVDCAPIEQRTDLSDYVTYTEKLASAERSWQHCDIHIEFAGRHETNRRSRRAILEYLLALNRAPSVPDTDQEGQARLGWIHSQLGYAHAYLKEYAPAAMYFDRAASHFEAAAEPVVAARYRGALADALELFSESSAEWRDAVLDEAVAQREAAMTLAKPAGDLDQTRYALGRLLGTLALRFPAGAPRLIEVRDLASKELPWRGPINEFSVAAVALGEAACRMGEGDYAGARSVIEMVLPYLDESLFLEDTERHARLLSWLARIYNEQGNHARAAEEGRASLRIIDRIRSFVTGDVYARTTAPVTLRAAVSELVRAALALGNAGDAFASIEEFHDRCVTTSLGGKIAGETHAADVTAEISMIEQRIPQLDAYIAQFRQLGKDAQAAWFDSAVAVDRRRLEWLNRGPVFVPATRLRFNGIHAPELAALQEALVSDAAYLSYQFGKSASNAVLVTHDAVAGFVLDDAGEEEIVALIGRALAALAGGTPDDAALDDLGNRLLAPVRALPASTRLYVAPDGPLYGVPFDALRVDGVRLLDRCTVTYTLSAGYLVRALARAEVSGGGVLDCCSGTPCSKTALFDYRALWTQASLCADAEIWLPNAADSAIVLADGDSPERFLYFGEFLGGHMPQAGVSLSLRRDWAAGGLQGPEVQALLAGLAAAGAMHAVLNLWQVPGNAPVAAGESLTAYLQRKRALANEQPGLALWARDVAYVF